MRCKLLALAFIYLVPALSSSPVRATPPSPEQFLGHPVGADRKLAPWPKVVAYLEAVEPQVAQYATDTAGTGAVTVPWTCSTMPRVSSCAPCSAPSTALPAHSTRATSPMPPTVPRG